MTNNNDDEYEHFPITYKCSVCRRTECIEDYDPGSKYLQIMQQHNICFNCAFILDILQNSKNRIIIVDNICYEFFPYIRRPFNKIAGTCGKEFYIFTLDTREFLKTNNLQCKGKIPEPLQKHYPNNAVFLTLPSYTKLTNAPFQCCAKGCWDRYRCVRYNIDLEKTHGQFNEIPETYVIGSQNCPSFIDIYELKK